MFPAAHIFWKPPAHMGCCISSGKSFHSANKFHRNSDNGSRDPPSSMEEETVKEVLSETPALKPPPSPPKKNFPPEEDKAQKPVGNEIEKKLCEIPINGIAQPPSEFYEISHPNDCLSVSADQMNGGGEVNQTVLKSSPVKLTKNQSISRDVELKREISQNRTLTRRSDQSPVRRNGTVGSMRMVHNRDTSPAMARRGLRAEPPRRDPDENSSRRTRSPATARPDGAGSRSALSRTPSVRKSGKSSPIRAATGTATSQKVVGENNIIDGKFNTQIESLENPLVSLECFIFLWFVSVSLIFIFLVWFCFKFWVNSDVNLTITAVGRRRIHWRSRVRFVGNWSTQLIFKLEVN